MVPPKSKGAYAPLAAHYYLDDSILEAGEAAELLWVRLLSFLSASSSDGFVTEQQLRYVVGIKLRNVTGRIAKLQQVGLIEAQDGGFTARSWHKWNRSAQERNIYLKRDRERKASKHTEVGGNSERIPDGIRAESNPQGSTRQYKTIKEASLPTKHAETLLPKDWEPTPEHVTRAKELSVSVTDQAENFRLHADTHDRRAANWNAAFTTWLKKSKPTTVRRLSPDKEWMNR